MVKSEFRRLLSDKKFLITFFVVLAFFIVMITVALFRLPMDFSVPEKVELGDLLAEYQANYEENRAIYLYKIGEGPCPGDNPFAYIRLSAEEYKQKMEYYRFMLSEGVSGTYKEYEFFFEMSNESSAYRGFYTMMLMMKYAFYPLIIFAIISAVVTCVSPYDKGIMKNYLSAPVGGRTVIGGKLFVLAAVNFLFWFIIFIWGLLIGAGNADIKVLFYSGERYYAQPALAAYTLVMLQIFVAMLFTGCMTVFIGQFAKKPLATGVAAAGVLVAIYALFTLISGVAPWELLDYNELGYGDYFPIINLCGVFHNAHDYRLWVALLFHIAVGAGMAAFIILRQSKNKAGKKFLFTARKNA